MPKLFVIAGPNGAGKSTSAPELLSGARQVAEFVNADVIQKEAGVSEIEAGRITLARLNALAEAGKDMAVETTLASHLLLPRIQRMQAAGYRFHLYFFWLIVEDNDLWSSLQMRYLKPTAEEPRAVTEAEVPWTVQDIVDAVNRAVTKAMRRHKERGESIVIWRDGRIVTLTADEIEIPEDERSAP